LFFAFGVEFNLKFSFYYCLFSAFSKKHQNGGFYTEDDKKMFNKGKSKAK